MSPHSGRCQLRTRPPRSPPRVTTRSMPRWTRPTPRRGVAARAPSLAPTAGARLWPRAKGHHGETGARHALKGKDGAYVRPTKPIGLLSRWLEPRQGKVRCVALMMDDFAVQAWPPQVTEDHIKKLNSGRMMCHRAMSAIELAITWHRKAAAQVVIYG